MAGAGAADGSGRSAEPVTVSAAAELAALGEPFWPRLVGHPFAVAVACGSLSDDALARWLSQGYLFMATYRRFHAGLLALTANEDAGDLLGHAIASIRPEMTQFRTFAEARSMPVNADPEPAALAHASFLRASLRNGYPVGLAVLYGTEMSYRGVWSPLRDTAREHSPLWSFVDNWSSLASRSWLDDLARLVDAASPMGATPQMRCAFERAVRYQVRLFDAAHAGAGG